jgi:hypothetical protein
MLNKTLFLCFIGLSLLSCHPAISTEVGPPAPAILNVAESSSIPSPEPTDTPHTPYSGITIDENFSIIFSRSISDKPPDEKEVDLDVLGLSLHISGYVPKTLNKEGRAILKFKTDPPLTDYWSSLVGIASLLGPRSKQIYVVSTGPGAVCCTNYWIIDVASGTPKLIFRSQDWGDFRDPMEVFDSDNDGQYELVQFDSCFRYFMDDCGTCTPEPRVVFKYDRNAGKYLPAGGIMQDFVSSSMKEQEEHIKQVFDRWKTEKSGADEFDLKHEVLDQFVQLLHFGKEREGWKFFRTYYPDPSNEELKEIRHRLAQCAFYQTVKSGKALR